MLCYYSAKSPDQLTVQSLVLFSLHSILLTVGNSVNVFHDISICINRVLHLEDGSRMSFLFSPFFIFLLYLYFLLLLCAGVGGWARGLGLVKVGFCFTFVRCFLSLI